MSLSSYFEEFIDKLEPTKLEEMNTTVGEITKKLNTHYYEVDSKQEHIYIVGSVGRNTAIKGVSDLDVIFDLPEEIYIKFDDYKSCGQSSLLQDVKEVLLEKYPRTKIRGDGQVVVIEFNKYIVEVVPGFKQLDGSFKYPNTKNSGSWKTTKPLEEILESISFNNSTLNNNFRNACRMLREWKNYQGIIFGGLLVDSLVYDFFNDNPSYKHVSYYNYLDLLKDLFFYLKEKNPKQFYWHALGSNQKVYNSGNGAFVSKAKESYEIIYDLNESSEDINLSLKELFGNNFPKTKTENENFRKSLIEYNSNNTEEFIEEYYPIDIKYRLKIDCKVTQDGFRINNLKYMLFKNIPLLIGKKLEFSIVEIDVKIEGPYEIIWKVKNEGKESIRKNQIRGELIRNNDKSLTENTTFKGSHYVECYIIKDGICVAKDKIRVPINIA